ncbi:twin-arginine translocase subunit TatC, partial [Phascolarctobacterium faecium]|uniref:twin-arginine translocase subunit TatC n=1 Tax=Phascolarctobacterium faecium TaxID=33025 RepID=UPI003AB541A9
YIDNFMMLVLCMGLAFELPLVTWLLSLLGLVHKSFLRKYTSKEACPERLELLAGTYRVAVEAGE